MNIVILAAGQGKRMRSSLPKCCTRGWAADVSARHRRRPAGLHRRGQHHSRDRTRCCRRARGIPREPGLHFVLQEPQLGTGHAVMQAVPQLDSSASTLVLYGDVPLITSATLRRLLDAAGGSVGVLTVRLPDRRLRPHRAQRARRRGPHRRAEDASSAERAIDEVNTGIVVVPTVQLKAWLGSLSNDNAQGEYYLTTSSRAPCGTACGWLASTAPTSTRRSA